MAQRWCVACVLHGVSPVWLDGRARIKESRGQGSLSPGCQGIDPARQVADAGRQQQNRRQTWARRPGRGGAK
ncbi:hypothetical protein BN844_2201 [Pseudomonas sp. SHC52]|nr:hypothetical protein BN844_2201 [Pseudomonas sp. SHC52]